MGPQQQAATSRNPNNLDMIKVGTYQRRIHTNIDRVWENVLDWEHLPCLHNTSFNYVRLDEAAEWGWRIFSNTEGTDHVELCVDKKKSQYVARSYGNGHQFSEIWTKLIPIGQETDIDVSFFATNVSLAAKEKVGNIYLGFYKKLWDEDEAMMVERQKQLDHHSRAPDEVNLGDKQNLLSTLPLTVELGKGTWVVREHQEELIVHSAVCPHRLGPLTDTQIIDNKLTCPWHGYQFDVVTGVCAEPEDANCRMPRPPLLRTDKDGNIIITSR